MVGRRKEQSSQDQPHTLRQKGNDVAGVSQATKVSGDRYAALVRLRMPTVVRLFVAAVAIGLAVYFLPSITRVALLFLLAAAIASALNPFVQKLPWRRGISGSVVALGAAAIIIIAGGLAGYWASGPLQENVQPWSDFQGDLNEQLNAFSSRLGLEDPVSLQTLGRQTFGWLTGDSETPVIAQMAGGLIDIVVGVVLVLFGVVFLLAGDPKVMLDGMKKLMLPRNAVRFERSIYEISQALRWWLIGHVVSATVIATLASFGFWMIGLPFGIPLGIAAGLASFVPVLGPTLVGLIAVIVGASQSGTMALWAAGIFAGVETVESYLLIPLVMRQAIEIPPIITLFTVVLWAQVFGVLGLLLALPIDLVIWSVLRHFVIRPDEEPKPGDGQGDHAVIREVNTKAIYSATNASGAA